MANLSKNKVKAMMPVDALFIPCDTAQDVESVYQTAKQAISEMKDKADNYRVSKSHVTLSVVVRTGLYSANNRVSEKGVNV